MIKSKEECKKVPQTISIPFYLYKKLIRESGASGKSLSEIVRGLLEKKYEKKLKDETD